jgi:hypothetical protein
MCKGKKMIKAILQARKIGAVVALVLAALVSSCGGGAGGVGAPGTEPSAMPSTNDSGGSGGTPSDTGGQTPGTGGTDVAGGTGSGGTGVDPGGVGSGGTGAMALNIGSIDGFGSVIVNDIRYNIDGITPQIEDTTALALGMTVQIRGPYDVTTMLGTASSLVSAAEVRGKITDINRLTQKLWVYGWPVEADAATVVVGAIGFAQLAIGDEVQIHGLPSAGALSATRIEKLAQASLPILTGAMSGLDTAQFSFDLAGMKVHYNAATLAGFGLTRLTNGTVVRVRSDSVPVDGVLQAATVQRWVSVPEGTSGLAITGLVENFSSVTETFTIAGITIDAAAANLKADVIKALKNGSTITASGIYSAGVLMVKTIKIVKVKGTPPAPSFSLSGPVQNYVSVANFMVQGQRVDASNAVFSGGAAPKLGQTKPPKVKVVGTKLINGVLIADTVAF